MADKKVKIDLKARLGRASSNKPGQVPSTPPGFVPPGGIAPPPGIVRPGGIPAPIFGQDKPKPQKPKIDGDDPFASQAAAPSAQPQQLKIEIDDQHMAQAKKEGVKKIIGAGIAFLILGSGFGYLIGMQREKASSDEAAVRGAQEVLVGIEAADEQVKKVDAAVSEAAKAMFKEKKYPADFTKKLSEVDLTFGADDLVGKNLNRLKPTVLTDIFHFAQGNEELKTRADSVRRLFDARKAAIEEILEGGKTPKIGYVVFVGKTRSGDAVGTFAKIREPFLFDKEWPGKVELLGDGTTAEAERYKTGEPFVKPPRTQTDKATIYAIPLEPDGVAKAVGNPLGARIETELKEISILIKGTPTGTVAAGDEKAGLIDLAERLRTELKLVGAKR